MRDTFRLSDDGPESVKKWFTQCLNCGWETAIGVLERDDLDVAECPECGSDNVTDESDYV